ncbi:MAG: hypothetical protein JW731_04670 [Bacteroidales bacterium]|nr:hypothetical protein [Bacteroidales bacterium]
MASLIIFSSLSAQTTGTGQDTIPVKAEKEQPDSVQYKNHSPHKATIYSLILPGLGQAYNKKYWKIPIVYAGFGVFYYFIDFNDKEYKKFREAYYHSVKEDGTPPVNDYEEQYTTDQLLQAKNDYRRNRDLSYILAGVWYALNVIDATVDAHLFTWEVDNNLSLRAEPAFFDGYLGKNTGGGVKLTLRF